MSESCVQVSQEGLPKNYNIHLGIPRSDIT